MAKNSSTSPIFLYYVSKNILLIFYPHGQNNLKKIRSYSTIHAYLFMLMLVGSWTTILLNAKTIDSTCKISMLILTFSPCFLDHLTLEVTHNLVLDFRVQKTQLITSKNILEMNDNQHLA
jgi:hypothetical protein